MIAIYEMSCKADEKVNGHLKLENIYTPGRCLFGDPHKRTVPSSEQVAKINLIHATKNSQIFW